MRAYGLTFGLVFVVVFGSPSRAGEALPIVVELYTSQSCSDCPPADQLITDLAEQKGVIALSFPITYWDMLGWKDTLAIEANTNRQKAYAKTMNKGGVYTPQIIVGGVLDVVGNRRDAVKAAIALREAKVGEGLTIAIQAEGDHAHIAVGGGPASAQGSATIWLLRTAKHVSVTIGGGENIGHVLNYTNVVRNLEAIGQWNGKPVAIDVDAHAPTIRGQQPDGMVVIVQQGGNGAILGAAAAGMGSSHAH